jgi:RNA polymerase sigma-70 factor (ECF subfamily)
MDGYSHDEISDILNISIGASKSNLYKAKANLRKYLEGEKDSKS